MPVGAADVEAGARRSGASDADERPSNVGEGFLLDVGPGQDAADADGVSPAVAADRLAEERMASVGRLATIRLPR